MVAVAVGCSTRFLGRWQVAAPRKKSSIWNTNTSCDDTVIIALLGTRGDCCIIAVAKGAVSSLNGFSHNSRSECVVY